MPRWPANNREPSRWVRETREFRRRLLVAALDEARGNVAQAARSLGIRRTEVYVYAKRLGVKLNSRPYRRDTQVGNAEWRQLGA